MKLFSRTSLVAVIASAGLVTGALVVPASAEETAPATETTNTQEAPATDTAQPEVDEVDEDLEPEPELSSSDEFIAGSSDEDGNLKASAIRDWIAVFTAIIGALSTVFVFADKLN
ncbi:hypothetical protein COCCU_08035 [Corynebacterium occultum]|uniref:Or membrane protein n=1 Tax=Corynebacterium occultum TaxID=2675219 RepID=A0A6B8WBZ5_9CORY|nr:hypothetical protein [Corynebacterium occultum]QGU07540.1 hypothetical protein COCCU_08035 [Corynebacterium occultum]